MGYPVSKRSRDSTRDASYNFCAEKDAEGKVKVHKLLIPWFRRSAEPTSFREKWTELQDRRHLAVLFKFPCYMPPGLFELMTVRAHSEKHKLVFLAHWGGGIHARHSEEKVQLLVMYYREGVQEDADDDEDEEEEKADGDMVEETLVNGTTTRLNNESDDNREKTDADARETILTSEEDPINLDGSNANILDSGDEVQSVPKRKSRRQVEQDLDMPETIEELPEEEEEEEEEREEEEVGELRTPPTDRLSVGPSDNDVQDVTADVKHGDDNSDFRLAHNGQGPATAGDDRGPAVLDKEGQTVEAVKVVKGKRSGRRRRLTESDGNEEGSIVLKFEVTLNRSCLFSACVFVRSSLLSYG